MKIVVLDSHTLNPGDLDWERLEALGEIEIYSRSAPKEVLPRVQEAAIILTNKVPLGADRIQQLPDLKYIGVTATGYDLVDLEAASENNIIVSNVPAYGTAAVAQHTIALLLELCNHVGHHQISVQMGDWSRNPDWTYWKNPLQEIAGKTLGIVGMGKIGRRVGEIARAFGMTILYHSPSDKQIAWADFVDLEFLFMHSDVVSLHLPLTDENRAFVNKSLICKMKPQAFLINTARGGLIQEEDLAEALNEGRIAGAGLDVLSEEPPPLDHPLIKAKNAIITPHNAWGAKESRQRLLDIAVENVSAFLAGEPQNVVNHHFLARRFEA